VTALSYTAPDTDDDIWLHGEGGRILKSDRSGGT